MRRPAVSRSLLAAALAVAVAGPLAAQDAGPVTKPQPSPAGGNRLPMPTGLTVRQDAQGAIVVSWNAVAGAARYNLGRSVGTEGFRQAVPPTTQETSIVDTRVTVGVRHVYTVTPIDAQGVSGMRATSEAFTPSRPYQAGGAPSAPTNVVARASGNVVSLSWSGGAADGTVRYRVRRNGVVVSSPALPMLSDAGLPPGQYQYDVAAEDRVGNLSPFARANLVTVEGTASTGGGTTSGGAAPAGGIAAEDAGGAVLVNVAAPVTLRVGGTHSLASVARGGWTSLSPAIASVTAEGAVSARSAGVAQLATVGADASGAVRVTVVRVRVTS
jgi:hypothetical protein